MKETHSIAYYLYYNNIRNSKITYIDIDDSNIDAVSFINVSKAAEMIAKIKNLDFKNSDIEIESDDFVIYNNIDSELYKNNRNITTIGRLIKKIFGDKYPDNGDPNNDIESFVNLFKSLRDSGNFELVSGDNIIYWYNRNNYSHLASSDTRLGGSCMKYYSCEEYIKFYANNPNEVSLLILKDNLDNTKIKGRALIWKLNDPSGRTFMDRIYTILDSDIELFKQYAIKNKWIYKSSQSATSTLFNDSLINKNNVELTITVNNFNDNFDYPYMDTLLYYSKDEKILTNNNDEIKARKYFELRDIDGSYSVRRSGIYVDYYNNYFLKEDLIYCEIPGVFRLPKDTIYSDYYNKYIALDHANNYMIICKYGNEYRYKKDAIFLGVYREFATKEYLKSKDNIFVWDDSIKQLVKKTDLKK
jgi:hypothetical protein